jgi:tetratricopeptide (TPR) repeat protein
MITPISEEEKAYLLRLATEYEKSGFLFDAASIYHRLEPAKAVQIYTALAKKAENKGFLVLAAHLYRDVGKEGKYAMLMKKAAADFARKGFTALSKECAQAAEPEDSKHTEMRELNLTAWKSLNAGDFEKARKGFLRAAEFSEKKGWYDMSMKLYFHAGDMKSAGRLRKLLSKTSHSQVK